MSTSYKPALLKALLRILRTSQATEVSLAAIGAEFVQLYWIQTVVFHLRQAPTLQREPEVVQAIRSAAELYHVRELTGLPLTVRISLESEMARILKINVLNAFHTSAPEGMAPLFTWFRGAASIGVPAESAHFLAGNANVLESLANLWWARYLEKVNLLAPLVIEKVERNGAQRASLAKFLKLLKLTDEPDCFYCGRELATANAVHVDHVIPWSFLLSDPLWDLVLACSRCNLSKSDVLPKPEYLDRLVATSARRSRVTLPVGFASPILSRDDLDRYYNAALSVEWPSGWSPGAWA